MPKTNVGFWTEKFRANVFRDARNVAKLERMGYRVAVIWECDATSVDRVSDLLRFHLL